jgi:Ca2+-binding RTX toxin-like protein
MSRLAAVPLLAMLAALVLTASASAAGVSVRVGDPGQATQFSQATVTGSGADADDLTVTWAGGALTVVDRTAELAAGAGCAAVDAHTATCASVSAVSVDGGAGDDRLAVAAPTTTGVQLLGGAGADVLNGGPGADVLAGGPGADVISGGGGSDDVPITVGATGLEPDRYDFRGGDATVEVTTEVGGVTLDLGAGALRLGDRSVPVLGVRNATLGPVAGTLLGTGAADRLQGAGTVDGLGGDDRISGRPGPDVLRGGDGDDQVSAGAGDHAEGGDGDDTVSVEQPTATPAVLACGAGDDVAALTGLRTAVPLDCERTAPNASLTFGRPRRVHGGVAIRVTFPAYRCGIAAWLRSTSGRALGPRRQVPLRPATTSATLRFPLSATVRTARLNVYFPKPCPSGKRWTVGARVSALLAMPARAAALVSRTRWSHFQVIGLG